MLEANGIKEFDNDGGAGPFKVSMRDMTWKEWDESEHKYPNTNSFLVQK